MWWTTCSLGEGKNWYGSGPLIIENAFAPAGNIFFIDNFFYHLTNLDLVFKDGVCVESETKSH